MRLGKGDEGNVPEGGLVVSRKAWANRCRKQDEEIEISKILGTFLRCFLLLHHVFQSYPATGPGGSELGLPFINFDCE